MKSFLCDIFFNAKIIKSRLLKWKLTSEAGTAHPTVVLYFWKITPRALSMLTIDKNEKYDLSNKAWEKLN